MSLWVAPMLPFPSWSHCVSCGLCPRHHTLSRALFQHLDFLTSHAVLTEVCAPPPPPMYLSHMFHSLASTWSPCCRYVAAEHTAFSTVADRVFCRLRRAFTETWSPVAVRHHPACLNRLLLREEGPDLPPVPFLDQPQSDLAQLPGGDCHHSWRCLTNSL